MRVTVLVLLVAAGVAALALQACGGNPPAKPEPSSMPVT
jgi:hypothetical protein